MMAVKDSDILKGLNEFLNDLDDVHSGIDLPDSPITVYDDLPDFHVYTVYDGGKIKYRLVLNIPNNEVMTLKYTKNGSLIPCIVKTGSTLYNSPPE